MTKSIDSVLVAIAGSKNPATFKDIVKKTSLSTRPVSLALAKLADSHFVKRTEHTRVRVDYKLTDISEYPFLETVIEIRGRVIEAIKNANPPEILEISTWLYVFLKMLNAAKINNAEIDKVTEPMVKQLGEAIASLANDENVLTECLYLGIIQLLGICENKSASAVDNTQEIETEVPVGSKTLETVRSMLTFSTAT